MQKHQSMIDLQFVRPTDADSAIATMLKKRTAVLIVLTSSADFASLVLNSGLADRLVRAGAELFALVGKESEQAHDALDWALDEYGAEGVATSWHDGEDLDDVATFVVASCRVSDLGRLLVFVDENQELGVKVKEHILEAIRADADS
jgi:hypothetical protein